MLVNKKALLALVGALVAGAWLALPTAGGSESLSSPRSTLQPLCHASPAIRFTCFALRVDRRSGVTPASTSVTEMGYSPKALRTAYGWPSTGGATETVGIVDYLADPSIAADLAVFDTHFTLPACTVANGCFKVVNQLGATVLQSTIKRTTTALDWSGEQSLDVEWAHAMAPKAKILLVEGTKFASTSAGFGTPLYAATVYAAQHANYVSMSWGGSEYLTQVRADSTIFAKYPTVSFFASSGDQAAMVSYPSTSPDVISVGGTYLVSTPTTGKSTAEYPWSWRTTSYSPISIPATPWTSHGAGGGCSQVEHPSAAQKAFSSYNQATAQCTKSGTAMRAVPDVSLDADPYSGVPIYDSQTTTTTFGSSTGHWSQIGGTSLASPLFAARAAISGAKVNATYVYGDNITFYDVTKGRLVNDLPSTASQGVTGLKTPSTTLPYISSTTTPSRPCLTGFDLCSGRGTWNTAIGTSSAPRLAFTSPKQTVQAGVASTAVSVSLSRPAGATGVSVTLSASDSTASVSTAKSGAYTTKSLTEKVAAGASSATFYVKDTKAGALTLTASATTAAPAVRVALVHPRLTWTASVQTLTITPGPLAAIALSPSSSVTVQARGTKTFSATGLDAYTNSVTSTFSPTWSTTVSGGTLSSTRGTSTMLSAPSTATSGVVEATIATVATSVNVTVVPSAITVTSSSQSIVAGSASSPITISLNFPAPTGGLSVSLTSSSTGGSFSKTAGGTYTTTLSVSVAAGSSTVRFYYKDTKAGTPRLTATATGWTSANQQETVIPGALSKITLTPSTTVVIGTKSTRLFRAKGFDAFSNQIATGFTPTWSTTVPGATLSATSGTTTTLTPPSSAATGTLKATVGSVSASIAVTVVVLSMSVTTSAQTIVAGVSSRAITVKLSRVAPSGGVKLTFSSSSSKGGFASSSSGTFVATFSAIVAATKTSVTVYYKDTKAGSPLISVNATGWTSTSQSETVKAAAVFKVVLSPSSAQTLAYGAKVTFAASGRDAYTNPVSLTSVAWTTTVSNATLSSTTGASITFTAPRAAASGVVKATSSAKYATVAIVVSASSQRPSLHLGRVR